MYVPPCISCVCTTFHILCIYHFIRLWHILHCMSTIYYTGYPIYMHRIAVNSCALVLCLLSLIQKVTLLIIIVTITCVL